MYVCVHMGHCLLCGCGLAGWAGGAGGAGGAGCAGVWCLAGWVVGMLVLL